MKLSYKWIKDYVDIAVSPEKLARALSMSGSEVDAVEDIDGDKVMELEITANRPDCLNMIGLGREVSACFNKKLILPKSKDISNPQKGPKIECIIEDTELCSYYTARVITDVKVKKTSDKIKKRITSVGMREVNNIVDITNFCLMETGQPLHAFDLDKIKDNKIVIREAKGGEKIVTIDEVERELSKGMLVIADDSGPIAIAGVMGGKSTEVTQSTKNILLESAYFDPISVRRTARSLALSSDSSYRFERGVDKGMVKAASNRASCLIKEEAGGQLCELYSAGKIKIKEPVIKFRIDRAEKVLGISLKKKDVTSILRNLGMGLTEKTKDVIAVKVPSFREDLLKEIDLIEEVARIYGYDKIPSEITKLVPQITRKEHQRKVIEKLYEILPASGLSEIMTYSLISEEAAKRFSDDSENFVRLEKALSEEHKVLTPNLVHGMLKTISWNINRRQHALSFFEIGKIYSRQKGKERVCEEYVLSMAMTGLLRETWLSGETRNVNEFDLKGVLAVIFKKLKVDNKIQLCEGSVKGINNCININLEGRTTGYLGEASQKVLDEYDISQPVYLAQVKLGEVIKKAKLENHYVPIPKFPSSIRDISILCDKSLAATSVETIISDASKELVRNIKLVDVYEGKQIPQNKKSLTYSIEYGLDKRTLTDDEIESAHSKIKQNLIDTLQVEFR